MLQATLVALWELEEALIIDLQEVLRVPVQKVFVKLSPGGHFMWAVGHGAAPRARRARTCDDAGPWLVCGQEFGVQFWHDNQWFPMNLGHMLGEGSLLVLSPTLWAADLGWWRVML